MKKIGFQLALYLFIINLAPAQTTAEFRGVWVATVTNIDWPSQNNLNPGQQRAEYIRMLDVLQRNGMNAVIVQVRPAADAFYPSSYEPWSEWLTGTQGKAPEPFYDPLKFMIEETHKRNMEFHAWFNPYRAVMRLGHSSISADHVTRRHPEWFVNYGAQKIFNPGLPEVREHITKIVKEVVERYDVDGIHFDDYFYPYPLDGRAFPDEATYRKYGNAMDKDDWRRSNVDSVILKVHQTIKSIKPSVKFGISPFGVWRNASSDEQGSNTTAGLTNYDDLYADILLWMENGWIDYVAPQLYWEIGHNRAAFEVLTDWWSKHSYGRHVYIGHGFYRATEYNQPGWKRKNELPNQLNLLRQYPAIKGSIFFSASAFYKNPMGWCDSLQNNYYRETAATPRMPWLNQGTDIVQQPPKQKPSPTAEPIIKTTNPSATTTDTVKPAPPAAAVEPVQVEQLQQTGPNVYSLVFKKAGNQTPAITAIKLYISYDESMVFEKSREYSTKSNCENCVFEVRFAPVKSKCRLFVTYVYDNGKESKPVVIQSAAALYFEKTDPIKNNWLQK